MTLQDHQLKFFANFIESHLGIIYSPQNYYQLEKRLGEIASAMNLADSNQLWEKAQTEISGKMRALLLDLATNNETSFFRDSSLFQAIEDKILTEPRFSGDSPQALRIWSCASSTGQEIYSMAIILNSWMRQNPKCSFKYLATDYSQRVLAQAESGKYSELEVQRGLSPTQLARYFQKVESSETQNHMATYIVNKELKQNITFKQQNLLNDFGPIGPFDLVLCRNVLIYQNVESKQKIIAEIAKKIVPQGYLVLGAAESLMGLSDEFELRQIDRAVVYQKK